jgi:cytochrome c oxidase assembly factor CtaG
MSPTLDAFLCSWPFDPWLLVALALGAAVYCRGWLYLHRRDPRRWSAGRLLAFLGGLATIFVALASPIEPFASLLLQVHMTQHLLLLMAAPPLLWLGAPMLPLLRGLPRPIRIYWIAPLFRTAFLRGLFGRLTHPAAALAVFTAASWGWHVPALYDLALRSPAWHYLQHTCFLGAGLLFWYPVVRPYPARPRWPLGLLFPYLILADLQNTLLSALLTFSDHVLYPYYTTVPRLAGQSALADQSASGVLMWVPGSAAFLLPLFWIGIEFLFGRQEDKETRRQGDKETKTESDSARIPLPLAPSPRTSVSLSPCLPASLSRFDLLRVPLVGRFLRWRHARLAMQLPMAILAAVVILDGLHGPQVGAMNLAGVLPWIHWRGFVVLGLLATGNVFCMACPFTLPRTLARRWLPQGWNWPRRLRNKWLAVVLMGLFLWAYEAFALWDSPWWTAWIAVGYFTAAFVVDGFFRGAAFCKYLCPIGQFNFVQSLASPLEVRVRDPEVCASCKTKDCIRGRDGVPGCEMHLFQPHKVGNMDCTVCLDCIHACPHDNIGVLANAPTSELWRDPVRSGVGRFGARPDLAALVLVLVFGAFANAAGMVGPVVEWQARLSSLLVQRSPLLAVSLFFVTALVLFPSLAVGAAAALSRWWGRAPASLLATATRFSYALVPLGFGMWLAHYSYHFLTSWDVAVPVTQRFLIDLGFTGIGQPAWVASCCRPVADWLPRLEILFLDFGLLLSLYSGYRIAQSQAPRPPQALKAFSPWAVLMVVLFAVGVWIVLQPMQMRGVS